MEGEIEIFSDFLFDEKFAEKEVRVILIRETVVSDNSEKLAYNRVFTGERFAS